MSRTVVIGDVHGCIDELTELLFELVDVNEKDRIIFLGDLIDRGPDPVAVVALAKSLNAECVMGNHEEKALRWRKHEQRSKEDPKHYRNPMASIHLSRREQWNKIPDSHWDWIASWPKFIHINHQWTGVHGGCMPDVEIEKQVENELMRLRYVKCIPDANGYMKYKMAGLKETGEPPDPKNGERIVHWTKLWSGPRNIVYGHYVWDEVHFDSVGDTLTVGADTGCVHGGHLTGLVFETRGDAFNVDVVQVKAHQVYAERKLWNAE